MSLLEQYKAELGARYEFFALVFKILADIKWPIIIETGMLRAAEQWTDGQSTMLFADFVNTRGGMLFSVDSNPEVLEICKKILCDKVKLVDQARVSLNCADSVRYLADFAGTCDLLYLDSLDYDDLNPWSAQQHCSREFRAAEHKVRRAILVDDAHFPNGGKPGLLKNYIEEKDWTLVRDGAMTLWVKK
jgi:hypothetical protein